jgi:modulator of FtsH protease HflK
MTRSRLGKTVSDFKNEGQAYANDVIPKAKGTAARMLEEANGYRQRVVALRRVSRPASCKCSSSIRSAPGVTRERLYLETMQQVLESTSKIIVDQKAGGACSTCRWTRSCSRKLAGHRGARSRPKMALRIGGAPQVQRSREAFRSRERESR